MELRKNSGPLKWTLIALCALFLAVFLLLPLGYIVITALGKGVSGYLAAITDGYALKAAGLTILATLWAVSVNTIFGIAAAWCLTKYAFRGKKLISTFIDLPVTVSPIIAGLIYVLTFGRQSVRGWKDATPASFLEANGSVWPLPGRWRPIPRFCSLTSPSRPSTPRFGWSCGPGSGR